MPSSMVYHDAGVISFTKKDFQYSLFTCCMAYIYISHPLMKGTFWERGNGKAVVL